MQKHSLILLLLIACLSCYTGKAQIVVSSVDCERQINAVIAAAESKLGCKYTWGATGPEEYDCSGLAQYAFSQVGIWLTRTTETQCQEGSPVLLTHIKRGDLVFFVSEKESGMQIGHVGIAVSDYKDGDFKFIHATSSIQCGCVCYSTFKDTKYEDIYGGARRIIVCVDE